MKPVLFLPLGPHGGLGRLTRGGAYLRENIAYCCPSAVRLLIALCGLPGTDELLRESWLRSAAEPPSAKNPSRVRARL